MYDYIILLCYLNKEVTEFRVNRTKNTKYNSTKKCPIIIIINQLYFFNVKDVK